MTSHACIVAALAALGILCGCGKDSGPEKKTSETPVAAKKADPA